MMEAASRATMVLLPKQVHLQKDVGAGYVSTGLFMTVRGLGFDLLAARERERKLKKVSTSRM